MFKHLTEVLVAWGPVGILLLSILDSSGFPVAGVFDALLILIAVQRPDVAWVCAGLAVAGSVAGNLLLFLAARRGGRVFMEKAAPEGKAAQFQNWFRQYGILTVFIPALIPIPMPLKLFVISAGILGTATGELVAVMFTARLLRYFGEAWLGVTVGHQSTAFLKSHMWNFIAGAAILFVGLYLLLLFREWVRREASL